MKREALVPIDEELDAPDQRQQRRRSLRTLARRDPGAVPAARTPTSTGTCPISAGTYRDALHRWLARCDIRDEHGQPVRLTPHQWRHTLGTRLINRDVPQHVVQKILDHDSPLMTAHYARLSRQDRPRALGEGPQGQRRRAARPHQPRRAARRRRLGQAAACHGPPRRCPTATASCRS